jgi:hypothetical protein
MEPTLLGKLLAKTQTVQRLVALDDLLRDAQWFAGRARRHSLQKATHEMLVGKHRDAIDAFNHNKFFWMRKRPYEV